MTEDEREARDRAIDRLRRHAAVLASAFDLHPHSIEPESERVRERYGVCFPDGRIQIRLHQVRSSGVLKYSVMVDTLCHELAHLRHFNHGTSFWQLYRRILAYARRQGIYRPGQEPLLTPPQVFRSPSLNATPRAMPRRQTGQLDLFPDP